MDGRYNYMKHDNDRTIFEYLNPFGNDMISEIKSDDLEQLMFWLNKYYLEYRNGIGIDESITFGIEIEMEHFRCSVEEYYDFQLLINQIVGNDRWDTKNDLSLRHGIGYETKFGREISSDILTDTRKTWIDIANVCKVASLYGSIGGKSGAHVHVGAQILGSNTLYWYRFLKLCSVYENIIYRFGYGEYLNHRPMMESKTKPAALLYQSKLPEIEKMLDGDLIHILWKLNPKQESSSLDLLKYYGISFWHMLCDDDWNLYQNYDVCNKYCSVEYRAPNGTFDPIIWQNNINFFVKLLLYCKSLRFNDDIISKRREKIYNDLGDINRYAEIYYEQALELCDMIFDNNLDKIYFMRQYLKSFEKANKPFVRAKRFTENGM